jgi:two-component system response regulator TctD
VRILLVEDDIALAEGLQRTLQLSDYAVDVVHRGADALAAAAQPAYDLGIIDLGLPDIDGLAVLRRLRQRGVTWPVLILTARDELAERIRGLDAGADDYIVKPFAVGELEARMRAVLRRPRGTVAPVLRFGPLSYEIATREVALAGTSLELPPRELAVLRKLVERGGRVVSKEVLFETLYGWDDEARPQAIEVYVSRLRKRLEPAGLSIRSLRGLGYRLEVTAG